MEILPYASACSRWRQATLQLQVPPIFAHKVAGATVFVGQIEMVCMSPSVHDISLPCARMAYSHMTHCLLVWSQQRRRLRHTHIRTCTHTEALSVTASLFTHRDTLSTFIALSQWGTLCVEKPRTPRPSASTPSAPGLDCSLCPRVTARLF